MMLNPGSEIQLFCIAVAETVARQVDWSQCTTILSAIMLVRFAGDCFTPSSVLTEISIGTAAAPISLRQQVLRHRSAHTKVCAHGGNRAFAAALFALMRRPSTTPRFVGRGRPVACG